MSTQNFGTMRLGLEVNVEEANKHFENQNKNRFQTSDEFLLDNPDEEKMVTKTSGVSDYQGGGRFMKRYGRFYHIYSKEFLMESSIMSQTKEVPPGPKSKSVPRNNDFFGSSYENEANQSNSNIGSIMIDSSTIKPKQGMKGVIKKRFAFLETGNDDNEEVKQSIEEKKENKLKPVIKPAATGAPEFQSDSSSERSEMLNFNKKSPFVRPTINTDAINEMFTFGGEKGEMLIRLDSDEGNEKFLKELDEIAAVCVAHMQRESPEDEVVLEPTDTTLKTEEDDYTNHPLKKKKDFMTPQTLRGYTKIEFSLNKEDDEANIVKQPKPYLQHDIKEIKEEPSPVGTSNSNSSKYNLETPTSNLGLDTPKALLEKAAVEEFNFGIELLYNSILEWMLNRSPSNLNEPLMIDDSDEINNKNVLMLCFNLIKYSSDLIKQKALQDFQMLCKLNKSNCNHILESKFFYPWILDLLLPYQERLGKSSPSGCSMAVYDIG